MRIAQFHKILFLVFFWLFAALFYLYFEGTIIGYDSTVYWSTGEPYNFWSSLISGVVATLIGSTLIGSFEVLYFNKLLRKKPFGVVLLAKTTFYIGNIFFFVSLAVILNFSFQARSSIISSEVLASFGNFLSSPTLIMVIIYWAFVVMLALFILHINDKFGKGVLINLLTGRYHRPRVEVKIFMFLDLTSSTTIAEKLGAQKYSSLIREFFFDLDEVINKTHGSIFQFVGDEVVVIWDVKNGVKDANCARLFFLAEDKIQSLREHYIEKFGLCPEFKAGLHYGEVIMTEVGGSKQEIAYHGDPINTAARIRSACNDTKKQLLISKELLDIMPSVSSFFSIEPAGIFKLKGKKRDIQLYGLGKNE